MSFDFKKEVWDSIQSLHQSGKSKNPHRVGKFGVGFISVYHITGTVHNEFMRGTSSKFIVYEHSVICIQIFQ